MKKEELKKLIDTAAGRIPADTVIKNCQIVNVFSGKIRSRELENIRAFMKWMRREDMQFLDLLTVTFISNLPTSARKNWGDFWCLMEQLRSLQIRMKL